MLDVDENRVHLGEAVRNRRLALGLSASAAAVAAGVARNTWSALEAGTQRMSEHKYVDVERTLRWEAGSIAAILAGGKPTPLREQATEPQGSALLKEIDRIRSLPMPAADKLAMVEALVALHAEAAKEQEVRKPKRAG